MSKRKNRPEVDSDYEDRVLDEYLAAKDAIDMELEREYAAGLSGVPEHGGAHPGDDDYDFNFGNNAQADLDFTMSAAAATAAAAKEAGLDMSSYVQSTNASGNQNASRNGSQDDANASRKNSRKKKHGKNREVPSEDAYYEEDITTMSASDEGLERFMRSIGFIDEGDEQPGAAGSNAGAQGGQNHAAREGAGDDSFGPAVGVKSPLDGKFDLRTAHVGNALGEGTDYPLLDLDGDYSALPSPEVLAAYPAEVQRKIIEWTDRDVRARRDNESLRQDIILREKIAQRKIVLFFAVLVVVVCIICAVATSILLRDAIYAVVFLIIPIIVVVASLVWLLGFGVTKR